jgi:hypothetical protein
MISKRKAMMSKRWILALLLGGCSIAAVAQGVPPSDRLTARELFFVPAARVASAKPGPARTNPAPQKAVPVELAKKIEKQKAPPAEMASRESEAQMLRAGYLPADLKPLGLRYTIVKRVGSSAQEVPADTVFRSGDRIQVAVETNEDGYLYIIARGSSGAWKPLFPSEDVSGGSNFIKAGKVATIPSGYVFTFDEQPGEEQLFVVFSRQPEPSLESLIYDLGTSTPTKPRPVPAGEPQRQEPAQDMPKTLLASNRVEIKDDVVGNMRRAYARDLIVEKVQGPAPASNYGAVRPTSASYEPTMMNAEYVVNPSGKLDARVVADVTLAHK